MDTPLLTIPANVTKTSFTAIWNTVTNATKYYIDVATNATFTTFVSGWQNKLVTTTYDTVTGLTDLTHYWVRVKAANVDDTNVSVYSYPQEILTGFNVGGVSIELANILADLFGVQGITIEVSTDFNLSVLVRDTTNAPINSANCLLVQQGWINKGAWNPNTDADPTTPTNGDYYTIAATGNNDITGVIEEFTTVDILVRLSGVWQIKKRRNVYTDAIGVANINIDYMVNNMLIATKLGYQIEYDLIYRISGQHTIDVIMYPVISVINTGKGYAVSLQPDSRMNKQYN